MWEKVKYALYRGALTPLAWLPRPVLYGIGSGVRVLLERVVGYRRDIIRRNLRNSFPEKTEAELRAIEHDFYSQLADNFVETIMLLDMSDDEAARRIQFRGIDEVNACADAGKSVILYLGHYGNWEFAPRISAVSSFDISAQVYKPLRDRAFDRLMLKVRSRFNPVSIPQKKVFRQLIAWRNEGKRVITGFIADHRSNSKVSHHEMEFLNHRTQFNPGGEEIGARTGAEYFYLDCEKPSRGHYIFTFRKIVPSVPGEESPYTREYMRMLEATIRRRPGLWLWSHRRWKWTDNAPARTDAEGHAISQTN